MLVPLTAKEAKASVTMAAGDSRTSVCMSRSTWQSVFFEHLSGITRTTWALESNAFGHSSQPHHLFTLQAPKGV